MSKYLLACSCGTNVPVDVGQAGGKVVCTSCGAPLDVPTLRKLRHLPQAVADTQPSPSAWGARHGVATAGLILAAVLAAVALGSRLLEPTVREFDPQTRMQSVERELTTMTPAQGFQLWVDLYRPLAERGFGIIQDPRKPEIESYIARQRFFQKTLLIVAALSAAIAIATALWPRPTARH